MNLPTSEQLAIAAEKRDAFIAAIPPELLAAEDALPRKIESLQASTKSKIGHIYRLIDELAQVRAPFVACRKGCDSCCRMNVQIMSIEAERIAAATGAALAKVIKSRTHDPATFAGIPCPFLDDKAACTIYEYRPLVCRSHASFFEDASACHPSVMLEATSQEVNFSGPIQAMLGLSIKAGRMVTADIRDFFQGKPS